ncbi:MAG: hypothetical protein HND47_04090 [Chloroflexi bacterium]|nr:hypothetical protein [Chloroflexota bacterium]
MSPNLRVGLHQFLIGENTGSANLEDSSAPMRVGQRREQVIHDVLDGNRLGLVFQPRGTGDDGKQLRHEADHLERNAARTRNDSRAKFGNRHFALPQGFARLDARAHVRCDVLLGVCQPAEVDDVFNFCIFGGLGEVTRAFEFAPRVSAPQRHIVDEIIRRVDSIQRGRERGWFGHIAFENLHLRRPLARV